MTLVFDFDSTMISDESLVSLLSMALEGSPDKQALLEKIESITNQGIAGDLDMISSYKQRLAIAKPTLTHINQYLANAHLLLTPHLAACLDTIRRCYPHVDIHVISQGPWCIVAPIAQQYFAIPSDHVHAVQLKSGGNDGFFVVEPDDTLLTLGKTNTLKKIAKQKPIVVVGDVCFQTLLFMTLFLGCI